jgi:hypothetical protein
MIESWPAIARMRASSASEALAEVKSGDRVYVQGGCATPQALVRALMGRAPDLRDVEIVHLHSEGAAPYVQTRSSSARTPALPSTAAAPTTRLYSCPKSLGCLQRGRCP